MTSQNALWAITFGDYALTIDRATLTYRLIETVTGTLWADGLSLGWVELEDRRAGEISRHDFGQTRLVSLTEKAGAQGKQILFGLDLRGIPIDVYLRCSPREIQITVEANRDTATHRIHEFGLVPGLCAVPDDSGDDNGSSFPAASHLVIPRREGFLLAARDAPPLLADSPRLLPIWDANNGVTMPFVGAVRRVLSPAAPPMTSALALMTDSAYGVFRLARRDDDSVTLDAQFVRDPERRRLDMRVVPLPGGDHIEIARAYRDKVIGEQTHITLRRKLRERPQLDTLIGGAVILLSDRNGQENILRTLQIQEPRSAAPSIDRAIIASENSPEIVLLDTLAADPLGDNKTLSAWDDMDSRMDKLREASETYPIVGAAGGSDWSAVALEAWTGLIGGGEQSDFPNESIIAAPLWAVVYHDCVVAPVEIHPDYPRRFLRALLSIAPPALRIVSSELLDPMTRFGEYARRAFAVLGPLHRICFPAFLNAHRFLTPDGMAQEAQYSNGARIVINQSATTPFETNELHLPPLGFFVVHPQMTAHDALRIGQEHFEERAWRITRARDNKPLTESADIIRITMAV